MMVEACRQQLYIQYCTHCWARWPNTEPSPPKSYSLYSHAKNDVVPPMRYDGGQDTSTSTKLSNSSVEQNGGCGERKVLYRTVGWYSICEKNRIRSLYVYDGKEQHVWRACTVTMFWGQYYWVCVCVCVCEQTVLPVQVLYGMVWYCIVLYWLVSSTKI